MEGMLNSCEPFLILEEIMKHRLEKESANHEASLYFFFSFAIVCYTLYKCLVVVQHRQNNTKKGYIEVPGLTFRALVKPQHVLSISGL